MIVDFYLNGGKDFKGRTLNQLVAKTDWELETSHDVVQWLFPLNEESAHNRHAPVLTAEDIAALRSPEGQEQFTFAFNRFMDFFGMKVSYKGDSLDVIAPDEGFEAKARTWLSPRNHNLKRITRIIRCAMLLGLPAVAAKTREAFGKLREHPFGQYAIDDAVIQFWDDAVNLPFDEQLNPLVKKIGRI